jgi:hypothetical protein
MKLSSPAAAIAWEIWSRGRAGFLGIAGLLVLGAIALPIMNGSARGTGLATATAYALTAVVLVIGLCCFHFTEGSPKGGFGSFPMRLFSLPLKTRFLVALPMIYGALTVVLVYLLCVGLLLRQVDPNMPLLWPCLYLVFGLTQFQMIIWSLPESRYLKLLCLSIAASIITFGWMFFVPTIVVGALSEWGYTGDPAVFMRRLLVALALTGPAAYAVSWLRVHQQRHGLTTRSAVFTAWWDRSICRLWRRRAPFRSADHAILWQEWRRTGFVLPAVVSVIIALTCVPAWLAGGLSGQATLGILSWLIVAPLLFAVVIGRGFSKPDFWSPSLTLAPFHAIKPVTSGQWVMVKLKVAFASAALTWALVFYLAFIWTAFVGDFHGPEAWLTRIRFYYTPAERWLLLMLAPAAAVIVTWRCLVMNLAAGLSGSKLWYHSLNLLTGVGMVALFIFTIRRSDGDPDQLRLYHVWPLIEWLPLILTTAVIAKMAVAAFAWNHALRNELVSSRTALRYLACWLFMVAILVSLSYILVTNTHWLRHLLMLMAVLLVPLAGPALAMRSLAANRCSA